MAQSSGPNGLIAIRAIVAQAPGHLQPSRWLLLERGGQLAEAVRALLTQAAISRVSSVAAAGNGQRPEAPLLHLKSQLSTISRPAIR
jgi:methylase of polypeptide subunit release factors